MPKIRKENRQKIIEELEELSEQVRNYDGDGNALDKIIAPLIEKLDIDILYALKKRSEYSVCENAFNVRGYPKRQKFLESRGIDTLGWGTLYGPIIKKINGEREDDGKIESGIVAAQRKLEELISKRVKLGKVVYEAKDPLGIPTEREDIEEKRIEKVKAYAAQIGLDEGDVEFIYRNIIMVQNKHYQDLYRRSNSKRRDNDNGKPPGWVSHTH